MKALRITRFGAPDVLRVEDVPAPQPRSGQALVRVRAAGVNRADLLQREGHYPPPADAPADIPGLEFAGEVVRVHDDSSSVRAGQRVFGLCSGGAQAELIAVSTATLVSTPATLDDVTAGAVAEAYVTAHDALIAQANAQPGERVLVHAVGSAVGIAVLEVANWRGCVVYGTSRSGWKLERAAGFGLRHPINSADADFAEEIKRLGGVDIVIDFVGAAYFERNIAALREKGRMVSLATLAGSNVQLSLQALMRKRLQLKGSTLRSRPPAEKSAATRAFERDILPAIADGSIRVPLDKIFPLEQAALAHEYVAANANFGKVVLTLDDPSARRA